MHHCQIYELHLCDRLTDISHDPLLWARILLICFNDSKTTNGDLASHNEMRKLMHFSPLNSQGMNLWVIINPFPGWSNTHTHTFKHIARRRIMNPESRAGRQDVALHKNMRVRRAECHLQWGRKQAFWPFNKIFFSFTSRFWSIWWISALFIILYVAGIFLFFSQAWVNCFV